MSLLSFNDAVSQYTTRRRFLSQCVTRQYKKHHQFPAYKFLVSFFFCLCGSGESFLFSYNSWDGEIMAKLLLDGSICYSNGDSAESLSGTDQTHTVMRQERVTGSIPKVREGGGKLWWWWWW